MGKGDLLFWFSCPFAVACLFIFYCLSKCLSFFTLAGRDLHQSLPDYGVYLVCLLAQYIVSLDSENNPGAILPASAKVAKPDDLAYYPGVYFVHGHLACSLAQIQEMFCFYFMVSCFLYSSFQYSSYSKSNGHPLYVFAVDRPLDRNGVLSEHCF